MSRFGFRWKERHARRSYKKRAAIAGVMGVIVLGLGLIIVLVIQDDPAGEWGLLPNMFVGWAAVAAGVYGLVKAAIIMRLGDEEDR